MTTMPSAALSKKSAALERFQSSLGLESRDGDLLRLIAQRLEDSRVAQSDRHRARDRAAQRDCMLAERRCATRPQEKHAERFALVQDGQNRQRREGARVRVVAYDLQQRR